MKDLSFYKLIALVLVFVSCEKSENTLGEAEGFNNRLYFILSDNVVNFSFFTTVLQRTSLNQTLLEEGPYTVLAPDNNAFIRKGYTTIDAIQAERQSYWNQVAPYHILRGTWELNQLPFTFNQQIPTLNGHHIYVTRWVKEQDTVLTINGNPVLATNLPASNGLIQALDGVMEPLVHATLKDAVEAQSTLTFLNAAIEHSGSQELLTATEPRTLFAPTNAAFQAMGVPDIDSIYRMSKMELRELLLYTVFKGLRFSYDYHLTVEGTTTEQTMLDGNRIGITLRYNNTVFSGWSVQGSGNLNAINVSQSNVLVGNGVLHVVDGVLRVNQ